MTNLKLCLLTMGFFLGGCAVQDAEDVDGDDTVETDEAAAKKSTRAGRIAACKADCDTQHTPCRGSGSPFLVSKGTVTTKGCNPKLSPDLSGNPFALQICKDACDKIQ